MGISGSGRASLERQLYLEKSRIQASSGNTALADSQRAAKNYKYNLQVAAQMKYVVTNRCNINNYIFSCLNIFSILHKRNRADLCNLPKERRYKLNLYKWVLQESNLSMSFDIAHLGNTHRPIPRAVITILTQPQQLYHVQKTRFSLCLCLWLLYLL